MDMQMLRTTGIVTDPELMAHDTGPGHPESAERIQALLTLLQSRAMTALPTRAVDGRMATEEEILRVHTRAHLERVRATAGLHVRLDNDTVAGPRSYDSAMLAAGCTLAALEAVLKGQVDNAVALVRPPGHHAEADRPMGFCLFNNVAIAALHARERFGIQRIAIVDFDVHHGNGTQSIFYEDQRVLYISTHQWPLFPGTGAAEELGAGPGLGRTINIPLSAEHGDAEYDAIYGGLIARILEQYRPELLIVSGGFDISEHDPLGGMSVTYDGFLRLVGHLTNAAQMLCKGRMLTVLEGGYSTIGLEAGVFATLEAMTGSVHVDDPRGPLIRLPLGDAARHLHLYRQFYDVGG